VRPQQARGTDLSLGIRQRVIWVDEVLEPAHEPGVGAGQHHIGPVEGMGSKPADPSKLPLSTCTARHPVIGSLGPVAGEYGWWSVMVVWNQDRA